MLGRESSRDSTINLNLGKFLINRSDLKILSERRTASAPEAGSKATVTIVKSKIFQPPLKNENPYAYSFKVISKTKIARIILSISRSVFPNEFIMALEVSMPIVIELKIIKAIMKFCTELFSTNCFTFSLLIIFKLLIVGAKLNYLM